MCNATAKVMSNTPPDVSNNKRNNCPVTINYVKNVLQIVNFSFCWQADKKYYNQIHTYQCIYLTKVDTK
jgi:hypothetical protein